MLKPIGGAYTVAELEALYGSGTKELIESLINAELLSVRNNGCLLYTSQDVAQTKPEYLELLAQLSGRRIAQYAKEVAAKKKACKDELSVIPSQIETARKLMPEEEDWVASESEIEDKNARIQQIEEQIADKSKLNEQEYQRKAFILSLIHISDNLDIGFCNFGFLGEFLADKLFGYRQVAAEQPAYQSHCKHVAACLLYTSIFFISIVIHSKVLFFNSLFPKSLPAATHRNYVLP